MEQLLLFESNMFNNYQPIITLSMIIRYLVSTYLEQLDIFLLFEQNTTSKLSYYICISLEIEFTT